MQNGDQIQDIVPPTKRRSIRDISLGTKRNEEGRSHEQEDEAAPTRTTRQYHPGTTTRSSASRFFAWILAALVIGGLVFAASLLFAGTTVTVFPKTETVPLDAPLSAHANPGPTQLGYEVLTLEKSATQVVPATGESYVEEKASGIIVVYNDFSADNQQLVANTRFETPDGKIYRIQDPLIVPGQQQAADGTTIPGSIEARVYADQPGDVYNIDLTDFTIPGFAGGPRFDHFYARSKTPMTGGFVGTKLVADEASIATAQETLRAQLRADLLTEARAQKPADYLLYDGAALFSYTTKEGASSDGEQVTITEQATLHAALFQEEELASYVARQSIAGFEEGERVLIENPEELNLTVLHESSFGGFTEPTVSFTLTGPADFVWLYDAGALAQDLTGRSKEALQTILSGYPGIERAEVIIRPFWQDTFPEDPMDITIKAKNTESFDK